MAVIVVSDPPNATKITDTAKKHSKVVGGERGEGVLNMAASTKVLPILDISLNGAFKTQLMTFILSSSRGPSSCYVVLFERLVKRLDTF